MLFAFEQVGGAQRSLEMARDYALQRYAFGRPIGSFQAIKHKLADVYVATELARSNAYYGAWALARDAPELPLAAAAARISANEAFFLAAKENIQVHGGMGYTWEFDCHLHYRRAKLLSLALGSTRLWKDRLITQLETANAPAVIGGGQHGFRRHPRRSRRSAPACAPSSTRTPSAASPAPAWSIAPATRTPSSASGPRTGRPRRPTPAMPASPGRRTGAGAAAPPIQQVIYDQEEAKYAVPRGLFDIGLGMCIPTLCTWGTQAQRDRFARKALRGEEVWCQLFSEPAAGSDLAGLRTRAERDGDDWVVNGQKIWTSGAHYCDFGVLVTRSDFSRAQAQGPHLFLPRHEVAGHRDPADQADLRRSRTSTRCSSPTCASPTASAWARSARAGRSRSRR